MNKLLNHHELHLNSFITQHTFLTRKSSTNCGFSLDKEIKPVTFCKFPMTNQAREMFHSTIDIM